MSTVTENLHVVRKRIAAAATRVGRDPAEITIVAVTKYAPLPAVREAIAAGQRALGESRPQQLLERAALLADERLLADEQDAAQQKLSWHMIGHLQRNKARKLLPLVDCIHSVDNPRLAETLDRLGREQGTPPRVLLEVNVSGETTKGGFTPADLRAQWPALSRLEGLEIRGLMTMAPLSDDPEDARPHFAALAQLRDELAATGPLPLPDLSMGMSGDFEVAIEEGATLVRIGSLLFSEYGTSEK